MGFWEKIFNSEVTPELKNIVYVHGANASTRSFRYIQKHLPEHNIFNFEYTADTALSTNIGYLTEFININVVGDFSLISHSLGGLMTLKILENFDNAKRSVSMSSPYGGSKFIEYLRWICPDYRLFKDLKLSSPTIIEIQDTVYAKPILQIVTSGGGNPLFREPNDGTVSVQSQKSIKGIKFKEYNINHFEVLLSDQVVSDIEHFIFTENLDSVE